MPYADPEKQRAAKAEWMRKKRAQDVAYREAENKARVERAQADPEAHRKAAAEWRAANPELEKEQTLARVKKWAKRNPELSRERQRGYDAKHRAKQKATVTGVAEHATAGLVVLS